MIRSNTFKTTLILFAIISFSFSSIAQFSGGGRLGVNFANLRGSSVNNNKMLIGYNIGGFINYALADMMSGDIGDILSIQVELAGETKGASVDYPYVNSEGNMDEQSIKQNFTYITVPVLAKFTFGDPKGLNYFGEAGFFAGALFGLTVDGEKSYDHDGDPDTDRRKFRDDYSGFDFGMAIGGGASIPFGGRRSPWRAFGNLRYSLGLTNIGQAKDETPDVYATYLSDIKTSAISLLFGVAYKF